MLRVKLNADNQRYECTLLFSKRKLQDQAKLASQHPIYIADARLNNLKYSDYDKFLTLFEQRVNDHAGHKTKADIAYLLNQSLPQTKPTVTDQASAKGRLIEHEPSSSCTLI